MVKYGWSLLFTQVNKHVLAAWRSSQSIARKLKMSKCVLNLYGFIFSLLSLNLPHNLLSWFNLKCLIKNNLIMFAAFMN